jgi:transposase-like protein
MSTKMDGDIKRWTAKRKSSPVLDIIQGKMTVAEASRAYDLSPAEVESWVEEGKRSMENALRANPQDVKCSTRGKSKNCRRHTANRCMSCVREFAVPAGRGQQMIETIRQGLKEEGITVSISKVCR